MENKASRFPHVEKVLDRIQNTHNSLAILGWTFVGIGATIIDLPGAIRKTVRDLREQVKKPSIP